MKGTVTRRRASSLSGLWVVLACGLVSPGVWIPSPAAAQEAGVESLLKKGFDLYTQGSKEQALRLFERAFAQNPSHVAFYQFIQDVTYAAVHGMLRDEDPRLAGVALEILKGARPGQAEQSSDAAAIRQAVKEVLESGGADQLRLMVEYAHRHGRNLVPELVPVLGDAEIERRAVAIQWIWRIGWDALPPLAVAGKHPEPRVRVNVAALLGAEALRHPFSLAYLKALVETDEVEEVRRAAQKSLEVILAENDAEGVEEAKLYFLRNAMQLYLNPYQNPFNSRRYAPVVYHFRDGRVTGEEVARFQLSQKMAEQAIHETLALDPEYVPALVLLLCNDCAQVVEYDQNVALYSQEGGAEDVKRLLASQARHVDFVLRPRTLAMPVEVMAEALGQALADRRPEVARCIAQAIRARGFQGPVPESLLRALEDGDSRLVRLAAAVTLAYWSPGGDFAAGEKVVGTLAEALVRSGVRTAMRAMGEQSLANRFEALCRELNMESYFHLTSVEEAYAEALRLPPDVIFLDEKLTLEPEAGAVSPVNVFVNELRESYRTAQVPVVVVVPQSRLKEAAQDYASEERKVWVVPQEVTAARLQKSVLARAFAAAADAKQAALLAAAEAAQALEHLASVRTAAFPLEKAVPVLTRILSNRPDPVRLPAMRVLSRLGAARALPALAEVYAAGENSFEARQVAMEAIARILAASPGAPEKVTAVILQAASEEANLDLRRAAWMALPGAGVAPAQYLGVLFSPLPEELAAAGPVEPRAGTEAPAAKEEPALEEEEPALEEEEPALEEEEPAPEEEEPALEEEEPALEEEEPAPEMEEEPAPEEEEPAEEEPEEPDLGEEEP